ncbi:hypothetical protein KC872_00360, partial [Candidatus Kaiserbacteria bacterium]|nr:hypothetical protein [Candidatus Kaiserbacteria bacterium]
FQTIQEYFSGLLSSAPYKNEGEMITGLVSTSYQMKAFSFNTDYNVELQPRAPETLVYENSDLDSLSKLSGQEIPTEGNLNFSISGLVDIRDETNPEFDLDMNLNALLEPFIIQLGAGVRLTEGNLYAKITDIPAMFKSQMPMEIPVDTWILLASAEEKDRFMEDIPVLKQTLKPVESLFSGLNSTLFANLLLVGEDSVLSKNGFAVNQLASGVQALGLQTSAMTDDQKHMVEYTVAALEQNPPIKFVSDPKKIVKDGETLYEYEVDVDYDNLMTFINSMAEESHSVYGRGEDISVLMGEIPSREDFEVFNELVDLKFTFRTDGSIQGVYVGSVFVPGGGEVKAQVDVKFETTFGHNNEAIDITMPDNVHPKSLSDMFSEMQKQYQQDNYDMTVKVELTRMRSMAELIYNENDYSYASVCSELRSNPIYTVATECSANDSEYVIYTALLYEPTYFCIDSTGAAWEVLLPPDEGAYSCPSGLPEDPSVTSSVSMEDAIPQYQSDFISP